MGLSQLLCVACALASTAARLGGRIDSFLIATFPGLRQVNYAVLQMPEATWRPLIRGGLSRPEALCVDQENRRLFVADTVAGTVVWYQLLQLGRARLMTDGRQHSIMEAVAARGLAVDVLGSLYIAGRHDPPPPAMPVEAIFKQDAIAIATSVNAEPPPEPLQLWTRANTALESDPSSPQLFEASGLAADALNVFWGNGLRSSDTTASVVKASTTGHSKASLMPLADNANEVTCLVLTPANVFYAAAGSVFGVPRGKEGMACGEAGVLCPAVTVQEPGAVLRPTGMVWDGDNTVYLADAASGAIYSFAAATLSPHILTRVADGRGVWGVAFFSDGAVHGATGCLGIALVWALAAMLNVWTPQH